MVSRHWLWPVAVMALSNFPATARPAPASDARAVEQASDAFGIRVGVEQIGLYSETQVRGFNLQDAGNYRVNGAYIAKSSNFVDPVLAGVVTRVGINALDADFAAPSGVVDYRLRSPFDAPSLFLETSLREYGGHFHEIGLAARSGDGRMAGMIGAQGSFGRSSSGLSPDHYRFGAVGEWRLADGIGLTGFGSLNIFDLEGFYGVVPTAGVLPPKMAHPRRYVPAWSDHDGVDIMAGLIADARLSSRLEASGSVVYSQLRLDEADYTVLNVDEAGIGRAVAISNRPRVNTTWSGSVAIGWRHLPGHRLFAELRARRTSYSFAPAVSVDLGPFDLGAGLDARDAPALPPLPDTRDRIEQFTAGIGYEITAGRLRLKGGVQRTFHERVVAIPDLAPSGTRQQRWLYDLSAIWALTPRWTAFASATRGLEESGVAPNQAANRNEVLPVAIATQRELGIRGRLTDRLTLIGSLFQVSKSAPGFDAGNVYRLIGRLRHQGAELSLVGAVTPRLRIVAGAVYLDAARSGAQVDAGLLSREAVGISRWQAMTGITWSVPGIENLSLDGQANASSGRRVFSQESLRTPAFATVDIGFRYAFRLGGQDLTLRGRILNLFDYDGWVAQRSEVLDRPARRGARLSLSVRV